MRLQLHISRLLSLLLAWLLSASPWYASCCPILLYFSSYCCCCSVAKSCPTLCNPLDRSMPGSCLSLSPRVCASSCPLSRWCYLTISSSYCTVRVKMFIFCVFFYILFVWKVLQHVTIQYYIADCISWVPRLILLDSQIGFTNILLEWSSFICRGLMVLAILTIFAW